MTLELRCRFRHTHLRNINTRPEEFQMFPHLGRLVLGVEDGQLCKHTHVSTLQSKCCFHESNQLIEMPLVQVVADEIVQLVSVNHDVETTHLSQTEL